ncbi:hypothetical protein Rxycam_01973 [Rubrobacter xylanophilus DSM 9941]|uniref:mycofactocin biosynthesis chaperone MftB n=1 Tax=Rubrobacter xylanophilus TaxID=49319 RepID=UPI001C63DA31|nr:mycofactocin biosynthesis chaperone MftB [Rubrobacter xylanophilus]QYJ16142.1 hypothetical protein Rxycam_01973 [Rubrobacter xylanophilus DSM 9941]
MTLRDEARCTLAPQVSVRAERFGGLVYRYDDRALLFLRSRPLVELLLGLDGTKTLKEALEELAAERDLGARELRAVKDALGKLEERGIVREL